MADTLKLAEADLEAALWERERAQTTALPEGLAVIPVTAAVSEPVVGLFAITNKVPFPKGVAVDVVVVVVAAPGQRQLQLSLADRLARTVRNLALNEIRKTTNPEELRTILLQTWELEALQGP
jgi:mannitol/fructose-specific phosphotransferase system IIA component (Ntr-type)